MSPGPTFDRVYAALKEQLLGGVWAPGAHLEPAVLGEDLGASVTPVRDALHRLVGERLVEAQRHDGFRVPTMTEGQLRALYAWNGELLAWALRRQPAPRDIAGFTPEIQPDTAPLFLALARATGDPELERAIVASGERLSAFRAAEIAVLPDVEQETNRLAHSLGDTDRRQARRELTAYHKRRIRAVPQIVAARGQPGLGASC